jgi:predicted ATPase
MPNGNNPNSQINPPLRSNHHDECNHTAFADESDSPMTLPLPLTPLVPVKSHDKDITVAAAAAAEYMSSLIVQKNKNTRPIVPESWSSLRRSNTLETVFLHGRAGVGKTFLLEDFRRVVREQQEQCLPGQPTVGILHVKHVMPSSSHIRGKTACGNDMAIDSIVKVSSEGGKYGRAICGLRRYFRATSDVLDTTCGRI